MSLKKNKKNDPILLFSGNRSKYNNNKTKYPPRERKH